jgi:hypothetical protein
MAQEQRFKVGDTVTYKDINKLPRCRYHWGGLDQNGFQGTIKGYHDYTSSADCWKITVSTRTGGSLAMIESDFEEWDQPAESALDKWKRETKALKLNREALADHINNSNTSLDVYELLEGTDRWSRADILLKEWTEPAAPAKTQFEKGDYIVVLRPAEKDTLYIKYGYIYKQIQDDAAFYTGRDNIGTSCSCPGIKYDESLWRYATPVEIALYDVEGKPVDVRNLSIATATPHSKQDLLEQAIREYPIGTWYKPVNNPSMTKEVTYTPRLLNNSIDAERDIEAGWGYIYEDGTWAEKVPSKVTAPPKPVEPPAFKIGDWVVHNTAGVYKVAQICDGFYREIKGNTAVSYMADSLRLALPHEIPKTVDPAAKEAHTRNALLEEAKRLFPIGTMYYALSTVGATYKEPTRVKKEPQRVDHWDGMEAGAGYIYLKGVWAERVGIAVAEGTQATVAAVNTLSIQPPTPIDWKRFKIRTPSSEKSREVQGLLFKLGFGWSAGKTLAYTSYLGISTWGDNSLGCVSTQAEFDKSNRNEVTLEQLRQHVKAAKPISWMDQQIEQQFENLIEKGNMYGSPSTGIMVQIPHAYKAFYQPGRTPLPTPPKNTLHRDSDITPLQLTVSINKPKRRRVTL